MNSPMQTIEINEMRKEYLAWFIDWRKQWVKMKEAGDLSGIEFCWNKMRFYGGLIDLTTRLKNSMTRRTK